MKKAATRLPSEIEEGSWLKIGEVSSRKVLFEIRVQTITDKPLGQSVPQ